MFVEKIWENLYPDIVCDWPDFHTLRDHGFDTGLHNIYTPKLHTIRSGSRWKAGDKFSPRVWSGKPYNSKQIIIAPDLEVKKVFDFHMDLNGVYSINGKYLDSGVDYVLAINDGLTEEDMFHWFMPNYSKPKEFTGQIICWSDKVEY